MESLSLICSFIYPPITYGSRPYCVLALILVPGETVENEPPNYCLSSKLAPFSIITHPLGIQYLMEEQSFFIILLLLWCFFPVMFQLLNKNLKFVLLKGVYDQPYPKDLGGIILTPACFYLAFRMKWGENLILDNSILKPRWRSLIGFFWS